MGVDHPGLPMSIGDLLREVRRIAKATLQNASIGRAGLRVYDGGWIRIEDGGLQVTGTATVSGTLTGSGTFDWTGPVNLKGAQSVTGPTTFTGQMTVNGPWEFVGNGEITGDVDVTGTIKVLAGGKIQVGSGASAIIIDGAAGTITVPGSHPLKLRQASGLATLELGPTARIWSGGDGVTIAHVGGGVNAGAINVYSDGIDLGGDIHLSPLDPLPEGVTGKYVIYGSDGQLYAGSPGGGGSGTPPAGNPDGYIWPADPAVFGISDDFNAHVARGSAEPGTDVKAPVGTPIWSPADGTIVAVNASPSGATGRYVTLVTSAGDWFRFLHASSVAVTAGQLVTQTQLLGYTGGSGFGSDAYYGPHLHVSFSVGYTGTFPGAAAMDDFEAYMAAL